MKLCRFGHKGAEKPGVVDAQGHVRDLSQHIADITPAIFSSDTLKALRGLDVESLPRATDSLRYGVPMAGIGKFIAIGLNYADHAKEAGLELPKQPIIFTKAISCITGPNDDVMIPKGSMKTDWEVELGIVIGKTCRYVEEKDALSHVGGYVLVNDVSERAFQKEMGSQWDIGKGCDTFGPTGPWLVTADEIDDPQTLDMFLDVNGARRQTGNTSTMIFSVATLITYVSRFMTLMPGDLLITGTPPGVGEGQKPTPIFLKPGDAVHLGIKGLGEQRQRVIAWQRITEANS
jgi:2,4-didehydro-3-deoxy-L-rhamnonate hydrolase